MLHELLVALYGHESCLIGDSLDKRIDTIVSQSERSLLRSLANLGSLHAAIRKRCGIISAANTSPINHVVSSIIIAGPLSRFQDEISRVESGILLRESHMVGAYDIVPLSGIIKAFSGWQRQLEWLLSLVLFVDGAVISDSQKNRGPVTPGTKVIDFLRNELHTGYPAIEKLALEILRVAEAAWVRQVSSWLLYGTFPEHGSNGFFVQSQTNASSVDESAIDIQKDYLPSFVDEDAAISMLYIGKSLRYIRRSTTNFVAQDAEKLDSIRSSILSEHSGLLASLRYPIQTFALSQIIGDMRKSLSRKMLHKLLPISEVIRTLNVLREFMLLGRGDFSATLIGAADVYLRSRHSRVISAGDKGRLGGMMIKETETKTIMSVAWSNLSALQDINVDLEDEVLESARKMITLSVVKAEHPDTSLAVKSDAQITNRLIFCDILLGIPACLSIHIYPPQDLFLTARDTAVYSQINSYLLSIRRTESHLSQLWQLSGLRKIQMKPLERNAATFSAIRFRSNERNRSMRATWTAISRAYLFISQLGEYLQGEIIKNSTDSLYDWIGQKAKPILNSLRPYYSNGGRQTGIMKMHGGELQMDEATSDLASELHTLNADDLALLDLDLEAVAAAHRLYLESLASDLLLDHVEYTTSLRNLVTRVDHLIALMSRLSIVTKTAQMEERGSNLVDSAGNYLHEESDLNNALNAVTRSVISGIEDLSKTIGNIEEKQSRQAHDSSNKNHTYMLKAQRQAYHSGAANFVPWKGASLGRLLLRLEIAYN